MRRERALQRTAEALHAARCHRHTVELKGQMRFLEREEMTPVPDDVGVGDPGVRNLYPRNRRSSKARDQRSACLMLGHPFIRPDPSIAIGCPAIVKSESVDHAVPDEPVMLPRVDRRELRIRPVAEQRPVEPARQFAHDRKVRQIEFSVDRTEVKLRLKAEIVRHRALPFAN